MEPSNPMTNTTTPPTKPDHVTTNVAKIALPTPTGKKTLSHSSSTASSPDSPLVADPFNSDDDDDDKSVSSTDSPSSSHKRKHDNNNNNNNNNNVSATEPPNSQAMERPAYRIPSSVFASSSNAQTDWSVASNDSLFSIQASFRNDRSFGWRSGELGAPGDQASTSTTDRMFSYSAQQPRCTEVMRSRELGLLAEATMKEVIREGETNWTDNHVAKPLAMASRSSRGSSTSTKSFAFSLKTGDPHEDDSSRTHSPARSVPTERVQVTAEPQPAAHRDRKTDPAPTAKTARPKKWFPAFSCCSLW